MRVLNASTRIGENSVRLLRMSSSGQPDLTQLLCHTPSPDAVQAKPISSSSASASSLTAPSDSHTPWGLRPK